MFNMFVKQSIVDEAAKFDDPLLTATEKFDFSQTAFLAVFFVVTS